MARTRASEAASTCMLRVMVPLVLLLLLATAGAARAASDAQQPPPPAAATTEAAARPPRPAAGVRTMLTRVGQAVAPPLPVYGRWCGPNFGSGKPVDAVDACCREHDQCYDDKRYFSCGCDQQLLRCLSGANVKAQSMASSARSAIRVYFDNTMCRCGSGTVCAPAGSSSCAC